MRPVATSWIWADEASGGVKGARVDLEAGFIEWVDQPGCGCGDAATKQDITDFLSRGPLEPAPDDVCEEMRQAFSIDRSWQGR